MKKISVVLVNYNGADDTLDCVHSIEQCNYSNCNIVIVDNCSTDLSYEKLLQEQKIHKYILLKADENRGFSAGNNIGIKYAIDNDADYILLLNNDTIVDKNFIKSIIEGFCYSDNCGATIGKILLYSSPDTIWYAGGNLNAKTARTEHYNFGSKDDKIDMEMKSVSFATGCCICLSRKVVEQIGLMDENFFLYEEDSEYSHRITSSGYEIVYTPKALVYHKVSASTGKGSALSQYYSVRNKYYFIKNCFRGRNKITAYVYCTLQFFYRCLKKEMNFKYVFYGFKGFLRKETGKSKIFEL